MSKLAQAMMKRKEEAVTAQIVPQLKARITELEQELERQRIISNDLSARLREHERHTAASIVRGNQNQPVQSQQRQQKPQKPQRPQAELAPLPTPQWATGHPPKPKRPPQEDDEKDSQSSQLKVSPVKAKPTERCSKEFIKNGTVIYCMDYNCKKYHERPTQPCPHEDKERGCELGPKNSFNIGGTANELSCNFVWNSKSGTLFWPEKHNPERPDSGRGFIERRYCNTRCTIVIDGQERFEFRPNKHRNPLDWEITSDGPGKALVRVQRIRNQQQCPEDRFIKEKKIRFYDTDQPACCMNFACTYQHSKSRPPICPAGPACYEVSLDEHRTNFIHPHSRWSYDNIGIVKPCKWHFTDQSNGKMCNHFYTDLEHRKKYSHLETYDGEPSPGICAMGMYCPNGYLPSHDQNKCEYSHPYAPHAGLDKNGNACQYNKNMNTGEIYIVGTPNARPDALLNEMQGVSNGNYDEVHSIMIPFMRMVGGQRCAAAYDDAHAEILRYCEEENANQDEQEQNDPEQNDPEQEQVEQEQVDQ
jgi:hypothetical protein